ncbi:hypothetical protein [Caulobacter segnis]|uniref:hypothetical protein n=1 Tax=Caulobacter segnis TaxID=88688 RepID=UPI00285F1E64|nr:hypothetical protein [Caulobacter segnis]MDR6624373.1 hypothetical protein [Caulobacter segnis]
MHGLQIKSEELIDAISAATRVGSTHLTECARRLREAERGDLPPLYIRERRGDGSPLQGTRQAANLLFASLQTASSRGMADAIERAEHTRITGDYSEVLKIADANAAPWIRTDLPIEHVLMGHESTLARLMDSHISFIRALEFAIIAACAAPDAFAATWSPMRIVYDGDRNEGRIEADFAGRDPSSAAIVFRYADPEIPHQSQGVHRESWLRGEVVADVGRAFRTANAKLARRGARVGYGA